MRKCITLLIIVSCIYFYQSTIILADEQEKETTDESVKYVTLDGQDEGITIKEIRLWKDYNNRMSGVATTASHGEKVTFIRREGDGVLVETKNKIRGWVTYYFVKEFK